MSEFDEARTFELFEEACELEGEKRAEWLARLREADSNLAEQVERLLRQDTRSGDAFDDEAAVLNARGDPGEPVRVVDRVEHVVDGCDTREIDLDAVE